MSWTAQRRAASAVTGICASSAGDCTTVTLCQPSRLPARNTYERDAYASIEAKIAAGMNHLVRLGEQATRAELEAGR
jgi:hypothetical protein